MATLTAVLILADGALAAIGVMVFTAHRDGHLTAQEAATFTVLGVSAALGTVVMLLAAIAFARGTRGRAVARSASGLAWLRLAGVLIAVMVIAIQLGSTAITGYFQAFGAVMAVAEASLALIVTRAAVRRTRHG